MGLLLARNFSESYKKASFVVDVKSTGLFETDEKLKSNKAKVEFWKIKDIDSSTGWDAEHGYIRVNKNNELLRAQYFNWEILFKPLSFYTRRYY